MSLQLRWVTVVAATAMVGGLTACGADISSLSTSMFMTAPFMAAPTPPSQYTSESGESVSQSTSDSEESTSESGESVSQSTSDSDPGSDYRSAPVSRSKSRQCATGSCTVTVSGSPTQDVSLEAARSNSDQRRAADLVISDFTDDSVMLGMGTEKKQVKKGESVVIGGWTVTLNSVSQSTFAAKLVAVPPQAPSAKRATSTKRYTSDRRYTSAKRYPGDRRYTGDRHYAGDRRHPGARR
ncbi:MULTISPECIES: hypothetical protein [Nonomuraea]|uniref:DUF5666 domain-containing protein n=1 Tax=Nonomuraea mangrovi TaxID=2316207 RepID=A0ABW4TGZ1_9ACTN